MMAVGLGQVDSGRRPAAEAPPASGGPPPDVVVPSKVRVVFAGNDAAAEVDVSPSASSTIVSTARRVSLVPAPAMADPPPQQTRTSVRVLLRRGFRKDSSDPEATMEWSEDAAQVGGGAAASTTADPRSSASGTTANSALSATTTTTTVLKEETLSSSLTPAAAAATSNADEAKASKATNKQRRSWEQWSSRDIDCFFEALNECGKNFEAIQQFIQQSTKRVVSSSKKRTSAAGFSSGPSFPSSSFGPDQGQGGPEGGQSSSGGNGASSVSSLNPAAAGSSGWPLAGNFPVAPEGAVENHVPFKAKDQIRTFYYRTWHKIAKYIDFPTDLKKSYCELYGLINYGELRKRVGGGLAVLDKKVLLGEKLQQLVFSGRTTVKLRGKKYLVRTPVCPALRQMSSAREAAAGAAPEGPCLGYGPVGGAGPGGAGGERGSTQGHPGGPFFGGSGTGSGAGFVGLHHHHPGSGNLSLISPVLPDKICLLLEPRDSAAFSRVHMDALSSPRLRITLGPHRRLSAVFAYLENRWKTVSLSLLDRLCGNFGLVASQQRRPDDDVVDGGSGGQGSSSSATTNKLWLSLKDPASMCVPRLEPVEPITSASLSLSRLSQSLMMMTAAQEKDKGASSSSTSSRDSEARDAAGNNKGQQQQHQQQGSVVDPDLRSDARDSSGGGGGGSRMMKPVWNQDTAQAITVGELFLSTGCKATIPMLYRWAPEGAAAKGEPEEVPPSVSFQSPASKALLHRLAEMATIELGRNRTGGRQSAAKAQQGLLHMQHHQQPQQQFQAAVIDRYEDNNRGLVHSAASLSDSGDAAALMRPTLIISQPEAASTSSSVGPQALVMEGLISGQVPEGGGDPQQRIYKIDLQAPLSAGAATSGQSNLVPAAGGGSADPGPRTAGMPGGLLNSSSTASPPGTFRRPIAPPPNSKQLLSNQQQQQAAFRKQLDLLVPKFSQRKGRPLMRSRSVVSRQLLANRPLQPNKKEAPFIKTVNGTLKVRYDPPLVMIPSASSDRSTASSSTSSLISASPLPTTTTTCRTAGGRGGAPQQETTTTTIMISHPQISFQVPPGAFLGSASSLQDPGDLQGALVGPGAGAAPSGPFSSAALQGSGIVVDPASTSVVRPIFHSDDSLGAALSILDPMAGFGEISPLKVGSAASKVLVGGGCQVPDHFLDSVLETSCSSSVLQTPPIHRSLGSVRSTSTSPTSELSAWLPDLSFLNSESSSDAVSRMMLPSNSIGQSSSQGNSKDGGGAGGVAIGRGSLDHSVMSINEDSQQSTGSEVDRHIFSLMTESSVDFTSKFEKLATAVASDKHQEAFLK